MPINIAWGPVTLPANTAVPTPPLTVDAPDVQVEAGANLAAQAAGTSYDVEVQYRRTTADQWREIGGTTGVTTGAATVDRQGNIVESGVRCAIPDAGVAGRQLRAVATASAVLSNVSGHVKTT
jgi:hypothetical protein